MIKKILLVLAVIIAGVIIWLAVINGDYHVKRSVSINVPVDEAYEFVGDFKNWQSWSPWLIMEDDVEMKFSGKPGTLDHGYSWKGNLVGSGEMSTLKLDVNKEIWHKLTFKEPFPSESEDYWLFEGDTAKTTVTWGMKGSMPFFFKFMAKQMEPMIGMDYDRGLGMLKEKLETGRVSSKVNVLGDVETSEISYIGIREKLTFEQMDEAMEDAFNKLMAEITMNDEIDFGGSPLTIYHSMGLDGGPIDMTIAVPVSGVYSGDEFIYGTIPAGKALKVQHLGRYENTGNAWATAYSYARHSKLKIDKKKDAYEIYTNDPSTEPDQDKWETIVFLPLK